MNPQDILWTIEPGLDPLTCDIKQDGWFVATTHDGVAGERSAEPHARRIAASVNLLRCLPLELLEKADVEVIHTKLCRLEQQRDTLEEAALAVLATLHEVMHDTMQEMLQETLPAPASKALEGAIREINGVLKGALAHVATLKP